MPDPPTSLRPKEIFRRFDEWTRALFEDLEGPPVFERLAERLVRDVGARLGLYGLRLRVEPQVDGPPPMDAPARQVRIAAFRRQFVLDLEVAPWVDGAQAELLASTLHSVLAMRVMERSIGATMRESAEIQRSLLRQSPPALAGYDIAFRCQPSEEVGGDLYDFLELDDDTLGLAVGDASGHGLPAALLVRDVVVGLRMGMERGLRPAHALVRLNKVIHSSSLSSCFVSLLYAELEGNGNLFYFNAGHEPPLLVAADGVTHLARGDTVIGPLGEARFKRHFAHVDHGATLLIYTDGLLERRNAAGELFGLERLSRLAAQLGGLPSAEVVARVFERVSDFGESGPWEDDATLLVVRRGEAESRG